MNKIDNCVDFGGVNQLESKVMLGQSQLVSVSAVYFPYLTIGHSVQFFD